LKLVMPMGMEQSKREQVGTQHLYRGKCKVCSNHQGSSAINEVRRCPRIPHHTTTGEGEERTLDAKVGRTRPKYRHTDIKVLCLKRHSRQRKRDFVVHRKDSR